MLSEIKKCNKCPLYQDMPFGPVIGRGIGSLMIVTQMPSKSDASIDELNSDHLGRLLNRIISDSKIDSYYITSLIKCTTDSIRVSNVKACKDWLIEEIETIKPKCLLLLGKNVKKYIDKYQIGYNLVHLSTNSLQEIYQGGNEIYNLAVEDFKLAKGLCFG